MSIATIGYRILLIEDNPGDSDLIEEMLMEMNGIPFTVDKAYSLLEGLKSLSQGDRPDLILVDLFLPDSQGLESFFAVQAQAGEVPVVVLTGIQSDSAGVDAVARGAQDFLVKTGLTSELLVRSVRYAMVRGKGKPGVKASKTARGIGFMGVKGGVGTTTLACHFASALKRSLDVPVLVSDLDLEGGALGFLLQSTSTYSIADAIENLHHLDAEYWKRVIAPGLGGLHVLKSPASVGRHQKPTAEVAACVLRFARSLYPWIVTDLGRANEFGANVTVELDEVFLVTTNELVSLQAARKAVDTLRGSGVGLDRIHLIHNRAGRGVEQDSLIREITGMSVYHSLPECSRDLSEAYVHGKLAGHSTAFAQGVMDLVRKAGGCREEKQASWLNGMKRLLSKAVA